MIRRPLSAVVATRRGPVTEKLQKMYFDQVKGRRSQFAEWLTPLV